MFRTVTFVIVVASFQLAKAQEQGFVPINSETTVSDISFRGNETFQDMVLSKAIITSSPGWTDRFLFWKTFNYHFNPVELQKDVHRLEQYYHRQGFLDVQVDYLAKLDSIDNKLDISFEIEEGPPLILQSVDFLGPDGRAAAHSILEKERSDWSYTRQKNTTWRIGTRPSFPELLRVQAEMNTWLRNHGYAFSAVGLDMNIDSTAKVMDVEYQVEPGPVSRIDSINVEWLDDRPLFDDHVILRQLPFERGDLFSQEGLTKGQRGLFGLNVFRFALVDMPDQPPDTTVDIRIRVQRGDLNVFRAETGYGLEDGFEINGDYSRRNFLGNARRLSISGNLNTAIGEKQSNDVATSTRQRLAISIFEPYVLRRSVSGLGTLFYDHTIDRTTQEEEIGGSTDFVYEYKAYHTISSSVSISRVRPLQITADRNSDPFMRGTFTVNALLGSTDDHLNPTEGYSIRPNVEIGTPILFSDVDYIKTGLSGTLYKSIGPIGGFAARLFRGRLWPTNGITDDEVIASDRYDRTRFYAGGADDVRGWAPQLLGPKTIEIVEPDTLWNPVGAVDKWLANIAYRFPVKYFPPEIQFAIFLDGAKLDNDKFRMGTGLGFRYRTPVGFIRLDFAYELNPSPEDLRDARDVVRYGGVENAPVLNSRRFRVHFGIGQAF